MEKNLKKIGMLALGVGILSMNVVNADYWYNNCGKNGKFCAKAFKEAPASAAFYEQPFSCHSSEGEVLDFENLADLLENAPEDCTNIVCYTPEGHYNHIFDDIEDLGVTLEDVNL